MGQIMAEITMGEERDDDFVDFNEGGLMRALMGKC